MITRNPMLLVAINNALTECATPASGVLNVAVNAWFEGHVEAETQRHLSVPVIAVELDEDTPGPTPPFPSPQSEVFHSIVAQATRQFDLETEPGLAPAAIVYAAGLAWAAGFREGQKCEGCSFRGGKEAARGAAIRAGSAKLMFHEDPFGAFLSGLTKQGEEKVGLKVRSRKPTKR